MYNNHTDLKEIKSIAKAYLYLEIDFWYNGLFAKHPFTESVITSNFETYDLMNLSDEEAQKIWRNQLLDYIDNCNSVFEIMRRITKPYRLQFVKHSNPYLSKQDLASLLNSYWQTIEGANNSKVATNKEIIALFKKADNNILMNDNERKMLNSLPDQVEIFRGVSNYNKKNTKAVSWTLDKKTAEWFANRFNSKGMVWSVVIPKKRIICLFEGSELEVIVDLYGFKEKYTVTEIGR